MPPKTDYVYQDQYENDSYKVVREGRGSAKKFHIRSKDNGRWKLGLNGAEPIPYHLPEVIRAKNEGKTIFITEGELDVETAFSQGVVATCNHGGAGKWTDDHSQWFRGANDVVILYDRDSKGAEHAWVVRDSLRSVGGVERIRFMRARFGNDLTDHISEGGRIDNLVIERPERPQPKETESDPEENPESDLPVGFRLIKAIAKGLKAESGKFEQYNAICPAHDDHSASLSLKLNPTTMRTMLTCHAGCTFDQIIKAWGIPARALAGEPDQQTNFESKVDARVEMLSINEEAKFRYEMQRKRNIMEFLPGDLHTGADELLIPEESEQWLIDSWIPADSLILLNAERKTGKSVLCLSLAKAICDEEPFLGIYNTNIEEHDMRVLYLNYEMTASMFRRWLRDAEFKHPERLLVKHLKGRSLPFNDANVRDQLAAYCARMQVGVIIFDTQIKAMTDLGVNENDNSEVTSFHAAVETLMELSGVRVCLFAHHLGKSDQAKGRGASRIEDGVDVVLTMTKESDGSQELEAKSVPRSLRGEGRDVAHDPVELEYNDDTRMYTSQGVSARRAMRLDKYEAFVERLEEFRAQSGRWPNTTEAKPLTKVGERGRAEFLEESLALKYVVKKKLKVSSGRAPVIWRPINPKSTQ